MSERTTVRLPEELLRRAKRKAAAEGRTLTALIEEGLRRVTVDSRPTQSAERVMPRVSTARGGLKPGFDWDKLSAQAQEIDDLEHFTRMKHSE